MSDDKPKHKPQKKHTLNEVLKSLQDLIRTDLVPTPTPAATTPKPPAPATKAPVSPSSPAPTPTEPDSFNDALEKLDDIITHNIIEPVERARQTPPEPLLPDETIEIEWDDTPPATPKEGKHPSSDDAATDAPPAIDDRSATDPSAELSTFDERITLEPSSQTFDDNTIAPPVAEETPQPPATENELPIIDVAAETPPAETMQTSNVIELETFEAKAVDEGIVVEEQHEPDAPREDNVVPLEVVVMETTPASETESIDNTTDSPEETIELQPKVDAPQQIPQSIEEPKTPDAQGAFEFSLDDDMKNDATKSSVDTEVKNEPSEPQKTPNPPATPRKTTLSLEPDAPRPSRSSIDFDDVTTTAPSNKETTQTPSLPATPPAPPVDELPTLTVEFDIADSGTPMLEEPTEPPAKEAPKATERKSAEPPAKTAKPAEPAPPKPAQTETKTPPPKAKPPAPAAKEPAQKPDATPKQEEIPVLKEIADLAVAQAAPLPDATQARDIAIRVIAKLNIERRKAGEAPLDIKTIEKLQQYLSEALNKRALNKPK